MKSLMLSVIVLSSAQNINATKSDTAKEKIKLENKIENFNEAAEKLDKRILSVANQAKIIDKRAETIVENTLALFKQVSDSRETGSKVIRHKKDLIKDLKKNIELYEKVIEDVNKKMKTSGLVYGKEFVSFHKWLENRVSKRIVQIKEMAKSFDAYKDRYDESRYSRYDHDYDYDDSNSRNRRMARKGDKERGDVIKDMNKAIKKLQAKIVGYEKELSTPSSKKKLDLVTGNIRSSYKKIGELEEAIQDILVSRTGTEKVGREAEQNLSKQLRINAKELKGSMKTMLSHFRSIIKLGEERAKLRYFTKKTETKLDKVTE